MQIVNCSTFDTSVHSSAMHDCVPSILLDIFAQLPEGVKRHEFHTLSWDVYLFVILAIQSLRSGQSTLNRDSSTQKLLSSSTRFRKGSPCRARNLIPSRTLRNIFLFFSFSSWCSRLNSSPTSVLTLGRTITTSIASRCMTMALLMLLKRMHLLHLSNRCILCKQMLGLVWYCSRICPLYPLLNTRGKMPNRW